MTDEAWQEEMEDLGEVGALAFSLAKWLLEKGKPGEHLSPEGKRVLHRMVWYTLADLTILCTTEEMWEGQ